MMKNIWRRNQNENSDENPQKRRKIAPEIAPENVPKNTPMNAVTIDSNGVDKLNVDSFSRNSDSNGEKVNSDSIGRNPDSNGEKYGPKPKKDKNPQKSPKSIQNCDFSPKNYHILNTQDSDNQKQTVDGEKPSTISVSFGCGPLTITTGGRSPPNMNETQKTCDLPILTKGGRSRPPPDSDLNNCDTSNVAISVSNSKILQNSDSNCGQTHITTVGCNKPLDNDFKSDTKCTTDYDFISTKCSNFNEDLKFSDTNFDSNKDGNSIANKVFDQIKLKGDSSNINKGGVRKKLLAIEAKGARNMPNSANKNEEQSHLPSILFKSGENGKLSSAKNSLKTSPKLLVNSNVLSPKGRKSPSYKCKKGSKVKLGTKLSSPLIKSNKKKVKEDKKDKMYTIKSLKLSKTTSRA